MIKKLTKAFLVALIVMLMIPMTVLAIAYPDSAPTIPSVYVFNDLLEPDDAGVLIEYFLPYAVTPTELATDTYLGVFVDTDGVTQIESVAPYAENDRGYGAGLMWIYLTAAEVTTWSVDRANLGLYDIWLSPNPTASWPGAPQAPQVAGITDWPDPDATSTSVVLALRVLAFAESIGTTWGVDLVEQTAEGNRLTSQGEAYFLNVMPNLRVMAPSVFASGTEEPIVEDIDYLTTFGATMTNGTGTVVGSPITLAEGAQVVNVNGVGTFTFDIEKGTIGSMTNGTGVVTGSPVDLVEGENTVTVTGIGTFQVNVVLDNTQTAITSNVTGTAFDLTAAATAFGFPNRVLLFSGLVWLGITLLICFGVYKAGTAGSQFGAQRGIGKVVYIVFTISMIGGAILGFVPVLVPILLFIASMAFVGYVLFFRGSSI